MNTVLGALFLPDFQAIVQVMCQRMWFWVNNIVWNTVPRITTHVLLACHQIWHLHPTAIQSPGMNHFPWDTSIFQQSLVVLLCWYNMLANIFLCMVNPTSHPPKRSTFSIQQVHNADIEHIFLASEVAAVTLELITESSGIQQPQPFCKHLTPWSISLYLL